MTTFEHAMVGVTGALAAGLHRRGSWKIVALAGAAAILPDWDSLALVGGMRLFDEAHRVWGHNVFAACLLGLALAGCDYRYDLVTRSVRGAAGLLRRDAARWPLRRRSQRTAAGYGLWIAVGAIAALLHLPADLVFSGGQGLTDWELRLFWPFSRQGYVYPMVAWGDPGATLIFVAAMFTMARWPARIQPIAAAGLLAVVAYIVLRGSLR